MDYNKHIYDDIIDMPYKKNTERKCMSDIQRAAQFSSFDALTGLEDDMCEEKRLTNARLELDDDRINAINTILMYLADNKSGLYIEVEYFVPDSLKSGGEYVKVCGKYKRIDEVEHILLLTDGTAIPIMNIWSIRAEGMVI